MLLCGGEERGTWLLERSCASGRSFAFALALGHEAEGALARLSLHVAPADAAVREFTLPEFVDVLREQRAVDIVAAPGLRLKLEWLRA